jgi:four helix bundle protein
MRRFDHERMEVYRLALEFVGSANAMRTQILRSRGALADQLDRAAVSIALNIAEGAGEFAPREKARFYRIARRSATECAAILDIAQTLELLEEERALAAKGQIRSIVAMLIVLGKSMEARLP